MKAEITTNQYLEAARLLSTAPVERLQYIIPVLEQAGFIIERLECFEPLSDKLKDLFMTSGKSIEELAEVLGVSRITLYRYMRGENKPMKEIQENIINYFGLEADFFVETV